ncbi:hypothetical protein LCGC14_3095080 [marine sediment metagenome]|uniref:Uncharacterized protein n=1 Tax=marine sediment metagenome TaxID=412755 RepID=A0A0F8W9H1_9ZZZZ
MPRLGRAYPNNQNIVLSAVGVGGINADTSLTGVSGIGKAGAATVLTEIDITLSLIGIDSICTAGIVIIDPEGLTFWICQDADDQDWTCVLVPDMHGQKD